MESKRIIWIVLGITGVMAVLCCLSVAVVSMAVGVAGVTYNDGNVTVQMAQEATVEVAAAVPTDALVNTPTPRPTSTAAVEEPTEALEPTSAMVEDEPTATTQPTAKPAQPANNGENSAAVGERVEAGPAALTVLKVTNVPDLSGFTPASGSIYLDFEVQLENIGTETLNFSPVNFKAKDASGTPYDHSWEALQPAITSGQLAPGEEITGHLTYEVPGGPGDTFTLVYTPRDYTGDPIVVTVKAP